MDGDRLAGRRAPPTRGGLQCAGPGAEGCKVGREEGVRTVGGTTGAGSALMSDPAWSAEGEDLESSLRHCDHLSRLSARDPGGVARLPGTQDHSPCWTPRWGPIQLEPRSDLERISMPAGHPPGAASGGGDDAVGAAKAAEPPAADIPSAMPVPMAPTAPGQRARGGPRLHERPVVADADTPVDVFMMRALEAETAGRPGAPSPQRIRDTVAVLLELDPDRPASWFAAGAVVALAPEVTDPEWPGYRAPAGQCRIWQVLGNLTGLARSSPKRLAPFAAGNIDEVIEALGLPEAAEVAVDVVAALVQQDLPAAQTLLDRLPHRPGPARGLWEVVLDCCERMTDHADHKVAQDLCASLLRHQRSSATSPDLATRALLLMTRTARAQRAWGRATNHLAELESLSGGHPPELSRTVHWERALVAARLSDPGTVTPARPEKAGFLLRRLEPAEADLRKITARGPLHVQATYLLACLALARGDLSEARLCFGRATEQPPTGQDAELSLRCQLWRALLDFESEDPTTCAAATDVLVHALRSGIPVPPSEVENALACLLALDAPQAAEVLAAWAEHPQSGRISDQWLEEGLHAHPHLIDKASSLTRMVVPSRRIRFLGHALEIAARSANDDVVDKLLDQVDDELAASRGWHDWADILASSEQLAALIDRDGVWVDLCILNALVEGGLQTRRGQFLEALSRVAAQGPKGVDLDDLLDDLAQVEAPEVIESARAAWCRPDGVGRRLPAVVMSEFAPTAAPARRATICFVGGAEPEERAAHTARDLLRQRGVPAFADVTWHHPKWGSNWASKAEEIEAKYPDLDALVLMPLVRTNFGRRIRRTSGQSNVPWFPCTGKGAHSMANAVEAAALWAAQRAR